MMNSAVDGEAKKIPPYKMTSFKPDDFMLVEASESQGGGTWNDGNNNGSNEMTARHHFGGNVVCFDFHVDYLRSDEYEAEMQKRPGRLWCNPATPTGD